MGYFLIVMIACASVGVLLFIMLFHFVVLSFVGMFTKKKYMGSDKKLKYGVIISARNEETVISGLIESILRADYPKDLIDIFVVAHNCTDATADVCRKLGAFVYEYNNPKECTVGYAYRHLFGKIKEDYGTDNYDGFLIMNADNIITENYIEKMNDAFVSFSGRKIITSYRNSKNFSQNTMSCLYGIFFVAACRFESRGRTVCGCSTRVSGTGYLIPSEYISNGWDYVTLTEDWEFSADQIMQGHKVMYCDEAEFYDEQPTTMKIMLRQRLRWGKGHMDVFFTRFKPLVRSLFGRQKKEREKNGEKSSYSVYDIAVQILPLGVIGIFLWIIQMALVAFSPLFGYDAAIVWLIYLIYFGICSGVGYTLTVLSAVFIFILERKRIGKVRFFTALAAFLLWPCFLLVSVILDVYVLFIRKLEWKPIPHNHNVIVKKTSSINKTVTDTDLPTDKNIPAVTD